MQESVAVITVDGPSGVGKGTLSQQLAQALSWHLLDSGALYRVLALAAMHHNVDLFSEEALTPIAASLDVEFCALSGQQKTQIVLEGEDVSQSIRTEEIGEAASQVAAFPRIREALLRRQRAFRRKPGLVADGRDMGTIVFPDAPLKVFLDATPQMRAQRRYNQLLERGETVKVDDLLSDILRRDERDRSRAVAPLRPAPDAILFDTTNMSIDDVFQAAYLNAKKVFGLD